MYHRDTLRTVSLKARGTRVSQGRTVALLAELTDNQPRLIERFEVKQRSAAERVRGRCRACAECAEIGQPFVCGHHAGGRGCEGFSTIESLPQSLND